MQSWARRLFVGELILIGAPLFLLSTEYLATVLSGLQLLGLPLDALYTRLPEPLIALMGWLALLAGLRLSHQYLADSTAFGFRRHWLAWIGTSLGVLLLAAGLVMVLLRPHVQHDEFLRWYSHVPLSLAALPALIPLTHLVLATRSQRLTLPVETPPIALRIPVLPLLISALLLLMLNAVYVWGSNYFVQRADLPALRLARLALTTGFCLVGIGLLMLRQWRVYARSVLLGALLPSLLLGLPAIILAFSDTPAWLGAFCVYLAINTLFCAPVRRFENALVLSLLVLTAQLLIDGALLGQLSRFSMKM